MNERSEHLAACNRWRRNLKAVAEEILGPEKFSWKSWIRHPVSNFGYRFWGKVPHLPDWELDAATWGEIDHEPFKDGCYGGYLFKSCRKCSMQEESH